MADQDGKRRKEQPGLLATAFFIVAARAHPARFRRRFGDGMRQAFADGYRDARSRGRVRLAGFLIRTVADLAVSGLIERVVPTATAGTNIDAPMGREDGMGVGDMVTTVLQDVRFAARALLRRPGFTSVALLTVALGVGANTAIFSVVNGVLLRPLPYPEPDELVMVWGHDVDEPEGRGWLSGPNIADLDSIPGLTAIRGFQGTSATLTGGDRPEVFTGFRVTGGLLEVFGLTPAAGRDIRTDEADIPSPPRIVVLGHELWQERFEGDPAAVGRTLEIAERSFEIVGVAPAGFDYPEGAELWIPYARNPASCGRGCQVYRTVARIAPDAGLATVESRLDRAGLLLADAYPDTNEGLSFRAEPLEDYLVGDVRAGLWILLGAVGVVLLIASANVANLLLVRASSRLGEVAVRSALGAGRARLASLVMAESFLLAIVGSALGLGLAGAGVELLRRVDPGTVPRIDQVSLDGTVLLFTGGVALVVALLFGLSPALKLSRVSLLQALVPGGRAGGRGPREGRARSLLLVVEVALSLFLLTGAGLLLKSFSQLYAVDLGFGAREVVRFSLSLPTARYDTLPELTGFYSELESRIEGLPGVASVGSAYGPPFGSGNIMGQVLVEGHPEPTNDEETYASIHPVTPGYFRTMAMPLLRGRGIEATDRTGGPPVAVVSERFVRENFPGEDPMGRRFEVTAHFGWADPTWTVVGIVPDVRWSVRGEGRPDIYVPHSQFGPGYMTVHVQGQAGVDGLLPAIREEVNRLDPNLALRGVETVEEAVSRDVAPTRFYLLLVGLFAGLAMVLAAVGLYGVVSYLVAQRVREIGVRLALGAPRGSIVRMVVGQGFRPALWGVVIGLILTFFTGRVMEAVLFRVTPRDPLIYGAVTVLVLAVVVTASLLPARRATAVDPVEALGAE